MEVASAAASADVECGGGGDQRKPPHGATEHGSCKADITDSPVVRPKNNRYEHIRRHLKQISFR